MEIVVKKKPKQYLTTLTECKKLLGKVKEKAEKSKGVRIKKKDKVREKMESGEYLPKDVYETQRKKNLAEKGIDVTARTREKKDKKKFNPKDRVIRYKGGDKKDNGFKKDRQESSQHDASGDKSKGPRTQKADIKPQFSRPGRTGDRPKYTRPERDSGFKGKAKEGGVLALDKKKLHPSWEAKMKLRESDQVVFKQNTMVEL